MPACPSRHSPNLEPEDRVNSNDSTGNLGSPPTLSVLVTRSLFAGDNACAYRIAGARSPGKGSGQWEVAGQGQPIATWQAGWHGQRGGGSMSAGPTTSVPLRSFEYSFRGHIPCPERGPAFPWLIWDQQAGLWDMGNRPAPPTQVFPPVSSTNTSDLTFSATHLSLGPSL